MQFEIQVRCKAAVLYPGLVGLPAPVLGQPQLLADRVEGGGDLGQRRGRARLHRRAVL